MEACKVKTAERPGLCIFCRIPAEFTCKLCGACICSEHFNSRLGICQGCLKGKQTR